MCNTRVSQSDHRPWLYPVTPLDKRSVQQLQFVPNTPGSQHLLAPHKRVVQESIPSKSGPQKHSMLKSQNAHSQTSAKVQTGSFESVRSKMRENLAAALALVSQYKSSDAENSSRNVSKTICGMAQGISIPGSCITAASGVASPVSAESKEVVTLEGGSSAISEDVNRASEGNFSDRNTSSEMQTAECSGQDSQYDILLPCEDVSLSDNFFARDELLQGNGLSWVLEPVMGVEAENEISVPEFTELTNQKVEKDEDGEELPCDFSPQILAFKIEAELFKLFGGVNKKYKEKGRSLLFNLKDPNNPELRERVVYGEIPPDRLCSMSAEDLASKELSEWRMAKAEEFAQMVVLPDSDVDLRRLVKKTHKGEVQVEVEQVDTTSMDVSIGVSSLGRRSEKENEAVVASPPSKVRVKEELNAAAAEKKSNLEDREDSCTITIPSSEGTELMQGLMVDNEMKDAEFLPPIVSLDEFVESLNSEPPFEDAPADAEKSIPKSDNNDTDVSESKSLQIPQDPDHAVPAKDDKIGETVVKSSAASKPSDSLVKPEIAPPPVASKSELVWEGLLQLNISTTASVIGFYKSGEKLSTTDWASFLEIKGRVKLDAFEKYLQQLPMSRSRTVMILHLVGKEGSPKTDCKNLSEVAESYVSDGRVGIAEPAPGMEVYFCPPHSKTTELLSKIVSKDKLQAFTAIENGLIGVLVWKKAQLTSTLSPNSASFRKEPSKKHVASSARRHQEMDTANQKSSMSHGRHPAFATPPAQDDDGDEVPPGFGPGAVRDDDDLPEFNFSGVTRREASKVASHHLQAPPRPVDQIRELIQKYGQPRGAASSGRRAVGLQLSRVMMTMTMTTSPNGSRRLCNSSTRSQFMATSEPTWLNHQQYRQASMPLQPQMDVAEAQQQNQWTHRTYVDPASHPGTGGVQFYGQTGAAAWRHPQK